MMLDAARRLRRGQTLSEMLLWNALRGRAIRDFKWRRQHPIGTFVLDFYCDAARLALEIDGPVHNVGPIAARDRQRQSLIEAEGIRFLRIPAHAIETNLDAVLADIAQALTATTFPPRRRTPRLPKQTARYNTNSKNPSPPAGERGRGEGLQTAASGSPSPPAGARAGVRAK